MASRLKEDERNERAIRGLLKLPENRRCINCNSLGPQYVCTNFWTFVCTTCSGIHREFTHRVKSVSMAKFTSQEVSALQGGGNASAKEIYFKEWDQQRHSVPDSSNVERLRDFIKHVYLDRRYTGERSFDKPPRVKMGETEDFSENRKADTYQGGSRSPPYEDGYERRYSDRPSPGGRSDERNSRGIYDERRSPGSDQDTRQYNDYGRSPARTEIVNDWRREDRFGNGTRSDDSRDSDGVSKLGGRSPDSQRDLDMSSPPKVQPVRDILGENVSPLRVIEPPKVNGVQQTQRTTSSSSLASSNGNAAEIKVESSLIDFDADPEPLSTAALSQTQPTATATSVAQPTSSSSDNWANFDSVPEVKVSQAPSNANFLESIFSELSVPAPVSGSASVTAPVSNMSMFPSSDKLVTSMGHTSVSPFANAAPTAGPVSNPLAFAHGGAPAAPGSTFNSFVPDGGPWQNPPFSTGGQYPAQPFNAAVGASSNQSWNPLLAPNAQVPSGVAGAQVFHAVSRRPLEVTSGVLSQPSSTEVRPTGKKELPEDLFTANYSSFHAPVPGWQPAPTYGMGYMHYNTAVPVQTFPNSSKSTNPFDLAGELSPVQASTFPSMASLHGALPNMAAPSGILRASSLGTPSPTWMPTQSSHPLAMQPQAPSFASGVPHSSYVGQQIPQTVAPRQQGVAGLGIEQPAFGSFNTNYQQAGLYSTPAAPSTFSSVGGNPFG